MAHLYRGNACPVELGPAVRVIPLRDACAEMDRYCGRSIRIAIRGVTHASARKITKLTKLTPGGDAVVAHPLSSTTRAAVVGPYFK